MTAGPGTRRNRNKRGEGALLRQEIVEAASALLEQTGHEDAVTLRAVARQVGITAPSIYAHFAGPGDIVQAVVARAFEQLVQVLQQAVDNETEPVPRLRSLSRAYLGFAAERPHLYRVLFERRPTPGGAANLNLDVETMPGAEAFAVLVDAVRLCTESGASTEPSPHEGAARCWVAIHGLASLRASLPNFPWPAPDSMGDDILSRMADLHH